MGDDLEFDYWPKSRLHALTGALKDKHTGRFSLRPTEDTAFWDAAAARIGVENASQLAESVHQEFAMRDLNTLHGTNLHVGDLSAVESRLTVMSLGIKSIVTIASHGIDPLWEEDGVVYHTLIVTPSNPIGTQIGDALDFISNHQPTLVCCSTGRGPSALICAAHLVETGTVSSVDEAIQRLRSTCGSDLYLTAADLQCLASLYPKPIQEVAAPYPVTTGEDLSPATPSRKRELTQYKPSSSKVKKSEVHMEPFSLLDKPVDPQAV